MRSAEEERRRARRYGRRRRLLEAGQSRAALDEVVAKLVKELRASPVPADRAKALVDALRSSTDDTRRHRAIWAIVDALEAHD